MNPQTTPSRSSGARRRLARSRMAWWSGALLLAVLVALPLQAQGGAAPATEPSTATPTTNAAMQLALASEVRLVVPGNSRFAGDVSGRDTVQRHLRLMGLDWAALRQRAADFPLAVDEAGWLVQLALGSDGAAVTLLVAATRNIDDEIVRFDLFVGDEARLARLAPREDGVVRTSLAAQRNLRQVRALHGTGGGTRFLAANGARVVAILDSPLLGREPQLVQYRFDAAGRVSLLRSASPLVSPCCNSSGSNAIFAYTITLPW